VTSDKLAVDSVTTAKLLDANVTASKIAADSVTTAKLLDANVTASKLAADSVTTAKLLDANVTASKLAADSVTTVKVLDASITTAKLADSSVTTGKLAILSVTAAKIADGTVTGAKIAAATVANNNLVNASLTIAAGSGIKTTSASVALGGASTLSVDSALVLFANDPTVVRTSGEQTIGGEKKFSDTLRCEKTVSAKQFQTTSDVRLKTNIAPLSTAFQGSSQVIAALNPVVYELSDDDTHHRKMGFIAQELQQHVPDAVYNDEYMSVDYNTVFTLLLKSHQELLIRVEQLESRI
jgi:hypothetical protein